MTVNELIEELKKYPGTARVWVPASCPQDGDHWEQVTRLKSIDARAVFLMDNPDAYLEKLP